MKKFAARMGKLALGCVKRFLSNTPSNTYESILFGAVRNVAMTFGSVA